MVDESFTYTLHHIDGTKETKIANMKDLYIFLNDKLELEVYRLEKRIEHSNKWHVGAIFVMGATLIGVLLSMFILTGTS